MAREWTENRRKVAEFLERYFRQYDRAPSLDEIATGTGLWKRSVEIVLKGLEKIGFIEITPGISRGIRLIDGNMLRVPLVGDVMAGPPAWSQDGVVEYIKMDKSVVPFDNPVALRVEGVSMRDAGILPGDLVLVRQQQHAHNGDTVIAYYNGGLTVKKLERKNGGIRLLPVSSGHKAMEVDADDDFHVVGRVMVVLRDLGGCFDMEVQQRGMD